MTSPHTSPHNSYAFLSSILCSAFFAPTLLACPSAYSSLEEVSTGSSTTESPSVCGDGEVQPPEECDDTNGENADDCTNNCTLAKCGDGIMTPGESCDDANNDDHDTCTNACTMATCGDGIVGPGEECDDANDDETDICTSDCTFVTCGDGNEDSGEECDHGADNADDAPCTSQCKIAFCGDGLVYDDVEECDGGNATPACNADCTVHKCGDGKLNIAADEECDDGNSDENDECLSNCTQAFCGDGFTKTGYEECDNQGRFDIKAGCCSDDCNRCRLVFATKTAYTAAFGGYNGAREICIEHASAAGLANPSAYKPWVSDDSNSPASRFDISFQGLYRLTDGTLIATGWEGLIDGKLDTPINLDELGKQVLDYPYIWTNTSTSGTKIVADACADFQVASNTYPSPYVGILSEAGTDWTQAGTNSCLGNAHGLYCFEDLP